MCAALWEQQQISGWSQTLRRPLQDEYLSRMCFSCSVCVLFTEGFLYFFETKRMWKLLKCSSFIINYHHVILIPSKQELTGWNEEEKMGVWQEKKLGWCVNQNGMTDVWKRSDGRKCEEWWRRSVRWMCAGQESWKRSWRISSKCLHNTKNQIWVSCKEILYYYWRHDTRRSRRLELFHQFIDTNGSDPISMQVWS